MKDLNHLLFNLNPTPLWLIEANELKKPEYLTIEEHLKNLTIGKVNQATLDLYAAESHEALENNLHRVIPKKSYKDLKKSIDYVFSKRKSIAMETVNYTLKGKKLNILFHFTPAKDKSPCVLVSTIDITQYKSLMEANKRLAKLPEANPDIIVMMSCNQQIKYINPTGKEAIKSDELETIFDILPNHFSKRTCIECQNKDRIKMQYSKNNKNYLMKIHPFPNEKECMITLSDITEYTSLKEEKKLLAKAFERNHQPLIMTNKKGSIIKVNAAVEKIYGYSTDELLGQNTNILNPGQEVYKDLGYSGREYKTLFSSLWKNIRNPKIGKWEDVVINQTKNGTLKWVDLKISTVFDDDMHIKNFIAMPVDISKKMNETAKTKIGLYKALADLAEMRDHETRNHMNRVGLFSQIMAQAYNKPSKFCEDIKVFAPLHDVGKVGIGDSILLAKRKLTDDEYEKMKAHTIYGYEILKDKPELSMAAQIALSHHENYDGSGYPHQIKGKDIPLAAHITSLTDVYDALRSKRPYKEAWSHESALEEIYSLAGTKFCPELIEKFKGVEKQFERIYSKLKG